MPLYDNGAELIRANLQTIRNGNRPRPVAIASLTQIQLAAINASRTQRQFPPLIAEVIFIGRHIYNSRIVRDGYTIEDVIEQITSALNINSIVQLTHTMTAMRNCLPRHDRYGNRVYDKAVFECTARYPRPELFSVVPTGDRFRPRQNRRAA